jgi:type II secretion system protein C
MASVRTSQRILLALTACLLLAVVLARMVERNAPPERERADVPAASPVPASPAVPAPHAAASPSADASIPHTKLPLRLLATVVSDKAALSLATIDDTEFGSHAVMREGQSFTGRPAVRLTAIERARVLLDNGGVREQLVLVHGERPGVSATERDMTPEEREHRRDLARRLRELTDAGENAGGLRERGGLLAEGDVSGAYEDGELIGVQVDGVRAGGLYDRIGLKNGDVVTDIGGVSLADPDAMVKVLEQAFSSDVLPLTVNRPGSPPTTVELPVQELEDIFAPEAPE